jgi:signal transduction histidine kinase
MTRKTERGAKREHAHESADREAFDNLSDEVKAEFDQRLGELMERLDETINEIRSDVAATHSDELDELIAQLECVHAPSLIGSDNVLYHSLPERASQYEEL